MKKPVAFITGASRGIGFAVAQELIHAGYHLALIAKSESNLEKAKQSLINEYNLSGDDIPEIYPVDVANILAAKECVAAVSQRFGTIDLLFNSAGISMPGTFDLDPETFTKILEINLLAPFVFMQEIIPIMKINGGGKIINMSSKNGKVAVGHLGAYSASKFALMGLTESAFRELSAQNISITNLCPGWVNTDMAHKEGASQKPENMIQVEDIAKTVRWLLSMRNNVRVMDIMLECANDVEHRGTVQLAKLNALKDRHLEEFNSLKIG